MLCLECGTEMRLVQVVEDTTMLVSGYEHHTWQCPGCSTIERRTIFTREKTPTPRVTIEPTHTIRAKPAPTVPIEPTQPVSVKVAQTAPVETTVQVEAAQTEAVKAIQEVSVQPTIQNCQSLPLRINAWAQALNKVQKRETAKREAADEAKRRAEFKVFWDNLLSVPSVSTPSEQLSCVKADQSITSPAPTARDEPSGDVTVAQPPDCIMADTEHAGIEPCPSSEPLSNVTPDEPVRSPVEPNAPSALTAHDEPSGAATLAQLADCITPDTEDTGSVNSVEQPGASSEPSSHVTSSDPVRCLAEAIASPPPTARDELSSTVTLGDPADCVMPDTEHAGIASSVEHCPSSEPLSHAKPNGPAQAPVEPIAAAPPTAPDEPAGPEERLKRPRRWWSLKKVGLKVR
jgi:hypothetical protein